MKQLRESDIHGAPLPFQAAASSSITCFRSVCDTIRKRLGSSELRQQLKVRCQTPCGLFSVSFARIFFTIHRNPAQAPIPRVIMLCVFVFSVGHRHEGKNNHLPRSQGQKGGGV